MVRFSTSRAGGRRTAPLREPYGRHDPDLRYTRDEYGDVGVWPVQGDDDREDAAETTRVLRRERWTHTGPEERRPAPGPGGAWYRADRRRRLFRRITWAAAIVVVGLVFSRA